MLRAEGKNITMDEGDYGLPLPIKITGENIQTTDVIQFKIKEMLDDNTIIKKEFSNLAEEEENTFVFVLDFTKNESDLMPSGHYHYSLKLYRKDELLNTIINEGYFEVKRVV